MSWWHFWLEFFPIPRDDVCVCVFFGWLSSLAWQHEHVECTGLAIKRIGLCSFPVLATSSLPLSMFEWATEHWKAERDSCCNELVSNQVNASVYTRKYSCAVTFMVMYRSRANSFALFGISEWCISKAGKRVEIWKERRKKNDKPFTHSRLIELEWKHSGSSKN